MKVEIPFGKKVIYGDLTEAKGDTLAILVHGHLGNARSEKFTNMAEIFANNGVSALCMNIARNVSEDGVLEIPTLDEEVEQMRTVIEHFRSEYEKFILLGHSQAGSEVFGLGNYPGLVGVVSLMGVVDGSYHVDKKLAKLGTTMDEVEENPIPWNYEGEGRFFYTADFLKSYRDFNVRRHIREFQRPVLFVAGSKDHIVKMDEIQSGYDAANDPKELLVMPGFEHRYTAEQAKTLAPRIVDWMRSEGLIPR